MTTPILDIVTNDGKRRRAGKVFASTYDGAHAEAREHYHLQPGEYKLERVGWDGDRTGLAGCGDWSVPN